MPMFPEIFKKLKNKLINKFKKNFLPMPMLPKMEKAGCL